MGGMTDRQMIRTREFLTAENIEPGRASQKVPLSGSVSASEGND